MSDGMKTEMSRRAVIFCRDPRLHRLLEMELSLCGVAVVPEGEEHSLVLADLDEAPPLDVRGDTRLLCWSRRPLQELPSKTETVCFLHRPFSLEELESCILRLLCGESSDLRQSLGHFYPVSAPSSAAKRSKKEEHWIREARVSRISVVKDGILSIEGQETALTPREFALFACLWENRGETVPKAVLRDALCAAAEDGAPIANTLEVYVCHLRRKLERPAAPRLITTVRGVGYRLEV